MARVVVILNIILGFLFLKLINDYSNNFVPPNTFLQNINLSGLSYKEAKELFENYYHLPIKLAVSDRTYTYNFNDFGVFIDYPKLKSILIPLNNFPLNIIFFLKSWFSKKEILPPFIYTQDFYRFLNSTIFDFNIESDNVAVDQENKSLIYQEQDSRYKIAQKSFQKEIVLNFGKKDGKLIPALIKVDSRVKGVISNYNQQLERVFESPVSFIIDISDSISYPFSISAPDLKQITTIDYLSDSEEVRIDVNTTAFTQLVANFVLSFNSDPDKNISMLKLKEDLVYLLNSRFKGENADTLLAKVDYSANTIGDKAQKYIEIDLSQQTMYLFENQKQVASHKISSGLYYPTPIGEFKILNKSLNAYSKIFNVWMPYWMAFYYGPDLNAYFGIHELPYYLSGEGERIQRPREFLGAPRTGGCVALDIGAAKEVYDFSFVGMPVYIFN